MGYARVSVVDVIQEMKISNTSNGLVLSQSGVDPVGARAPWAQKKKF